MLVHDPGGALAADHAAIDGMARVPLDITDTAILQMDFNPAAARAHIAGRRLDLVGNHGRGIDCLARPPIVAPAFPPTLIVHFEISSAGSSVPGSFSMANPRSR